ncbi:hypothetical protein J2W28_002572 [Variovorax boronicumulans]|uniref:DUF2894 domain-containing protein n=1 Tax=Variovorax boronicumulans TaxID=436515 RepID=UPI002780207B|nr:DUF2894 domain-containing protein [Variovorax boronicumulans]MDP9991211.1 hypothetical protein [Variovorax boronicumulans]MDQ0003425.1 hypothetical protein [Variovorax boronicumulans]
MSSSDEAGGIDATLGAWRERGAHRLDPVRFHFIETLARRATEYSGEARRILDERVATLLAAYGEDLEKASGAEIAAAARQPSRGPLAELTAHFAQQGASERMDPATHELKVLPFFRSTWSKLSAERRLTQSLAKLPQNAGPLNSHNLVHQSLTLMRELSPEYLNKFVSYVDALLWVDQANAPASNDAAPRAEGGKKAARSKSG